MVAMPPVPLRVPIVDGHRRPTLAFREWLELLQKRAGGDGEAVIVLSVSLSTTDNAVAKFDGTEGINIQASSVIIDDSENITGVNAITTSGLATLGASAAVTGNITVTGTVDGRDVATDGTKLDGIEAGASGDQTDAEIKTAYENNADTNAFTDADETKLDGIEASADVNAVIVGMLEGAETAVGQAALASAGTVAVFTVDGSETWKVREMYLSGDGTNFSGGGGDRLLDIKEGSTIYSTIPAATLQSLAVARWGDTGLPFPATASHLTTATSAGGDIVAAYSGGTTDYTAGALTLVIVAERTA